MFAHFQTLDWINATAAAKPADLRREALRLDSQRIAKA
jgi:hypothetical protein